MWLRDAVREKDGKDTLSSIDDLNDRKYFPYRWGQAVWAYVCGRYGDDALNRILAIGAAAGDANRRDRTSARREDRAAVGRLAESIRATYRPILFNLTPGF